MSRHLLPIAASAALLAVAMSASPAAAGIGRETWDLYDCQGPAGTPSSFSATRSVVSFGNALVLVGGAGTFTVLYAYNNDLQVWLHAPAPGMLEAATVACETIGPRMGYHLTAYGILTGPSA